MMVSESSDHVTAPLRLCIDLPVGVSTAAVAAVATVSAAAIAAAVRHAVEFRGRNWMRSGERIW